MDRSRCMITYISPMELETLDSPFFGGNKGTNQKIIQPHSQLVHPYFFALEKIIS